MREADSHSAVTPGCRGLRVFEHAQVTPVLLLLVKERVFERECLLGQLLVAIIRSGAGEMRQSPADAGYAMCKAAHSFGRVSVGPVSLSVLPSGVLVQQISQLRSDADVALIPCFAGEHEQWSDGASTAGKQVVDIVPCSRFGKLVRELASAA